MRWGKAIAWLATLAFVLSPIYFCIGRVPSHKVYAHVTGYNTVPAQTDATPCIGAKGTNICGRTDVVACPREIALGRKVEINGVTYKCEDRTAPKFNSRFDISCDKDKACPYHVAGWKTVKVNDE